MLEVMHNKKLYDTFKITTGVRHLPTVAYAPTYTKEGQPRLTQKAQKTCKRIKIQTTMLKAGFERRGMDSSS